jgi:hypothetical protein
MHISRVHLQQHIIVQSETITDLPPEVFDLGGHIFQPEDEVIVTQISDDSVLITDKGRMGPDVKYFRLYTSASGNLPEIEHKN